LNRTVRDVEVELAELEAEIAELVDQDVSVGHGDTTPIDERRRRKTVALAALRLRRQVLLVEWQLAK
jgi:hypothetical protein